MMIITEDGTRHVKVLFPKKAFWKIFEEELFCRPLDRNFAVLTSDQSMWSVRVAIKVLQVVYPEKPLMQ